jgi:hypothetical protein
MIRFEKAPGQWGEWIVIPTGGGGGGRDDKLTDLQKQLVEVGNLVKGQAANSGKVIGTDGTTLQWVTGGGGGSNTVLSGSGVPSAGLGSDGDFYIDTATFNIYGPKTSGAWGSAVSLIGPGVPAGGSTNQVLAKVSATNYDTAWVNAPSSLTVQDEGSTLTSAATSLNFTGAGVTATNSGGAVTVAISGGGGGGSTSPKALLDTWMIGAM